MASSTFKGWSINDTEVAKYAIHPHGPSGGTLLLYIPKIMPNISMGKPKTFPVSINTSCFCNASDCKPSVRRQLSHQNYISVPPLDNREFKNPFFKFGDTLHVEVHNGNIDDLHITTKCDNSRVTV